MTERGRAADALEAERFDVAIIGGGITGAGVAREAALRGLSVVLFEAEDFASGTSSRSSKLIHGGLRYLALGDVALVRESALERKVIFRLAPHLAERRWMVLPVRSRAALLKFRAAITTYEKLGAVERADVHQNWDADDLERQEPALDRSQWRFACAYREYLTDDARLVLANLRAAAGLGARALNWAEVTGIGVENGRAAVVTARCRLTGRQIRVRAGCVVNAAGAWVEALRRLEDPAAPKLLHLSKGVHIGIPAARLPVRNLLLLGTDDRRGIFALRRDEIVFIGTTDTTYTRGADLWPRVSRADVEYLLAPLKHYFREGKVEAADVRTAWAGLRPLVAEPGKPPTDISRKDEILLGPAGVVTIAGGKLTGYRPMALRTLERVQSVLGRPLPEAPEGPPLPGGDFAGDLGPLADALAREHGVGAACAHRLARLYGSEAAEVVRLGSESLAPGAPVIAGEVDWAVSREAAATVEDVLYRRTRAALFEAEARDAVAEPIARRMAGLLGWSAEKTAVELAGARARLAADLDFEDAPA
ncbi:MAG: glycerol-3-phosphate dehydrogenase/oxidase [Myxococcota bacterium]